MNELEEVYQQGQEDGYAMAVWQFQKRKEAEDKARAHEAKKFANWRLSERKRLNSPWPTRDEELKEAA